MFYNSCVLPSLYCLYGFLKSFDQESSWTPSMKLDSLAVFCRWNISAHLGRGLPPHCPVRQWHAQGYLRVCLPPSRTHNRSSPWAYRTKQVTRVHWAAGVLCYLFVRSLDPAILEEAHH